MSRPWYRCVLLCVTLIAPFGCVDSTRDLPVESGSFTTRHGALRSGETLFLSTRNRAHLGLSGQEMGPGEAWSYNVIDDQIGAKLEIPIQNQKQTPARKTKLNALHILDDGTLLLSVGRPATLGTQLSGPLAFGRGDVVRYDPQNDTAELFWKGRDHLVRGRVNIDAITHIGGTLFAFSTKHAEVFATGGTTVAVQRGDIVVFDHATDGVSVLHPASEIFEDADAQLNALHANADGTFLISSAGVGTAGVNGLA
jgi:hypothetical protein